MSTKQQLFANVASTTLSASITSSQTTFSVVSSANFPAASTSAETEFTAALFDTAVPPNVLEFVRVTNVSGTTWTVVRQAEDATRFPAQARASGTRISAIVTRGAFESFETRSRAFGHNVLDYDAVGDSNHTSGGGTNDGPAINAAYTAARSANGYSLVSYPAGRTYGTSETIIVRSGATRSVRSIGIGAVNKAGTPIPTIVWAGGGTGPLMDASASGQNIPNTGFDNLRFMGRQVATVLIRMGPDGGVGSAKPDTGTFWNECWFQQCVGSHVYMDGNGTTNLWISGGRADSCVDYPFYFKLSSRSAISIEKLTYDNAGASGLDPMGFLHLDMSAADVNTWAAVSLRDLNIEGNTNWRIADAAGVNASDKAGVIHYTIPTTLNRPGRVPLMLTMDNIKMDSLISTRRSHSVILVLGGVIADRTSRLAAAINGLTGTSGDGTDATGDMIPIGNITYADQPSNASTGFQTANWTRLTYPRVGQTLTDIETGQTPRVWA